MIGRLIGSIDALEKGLDAYWLRGEVIADNIANYNTPDFKASRVEFEDYFRDALENGGTFENKKTREQHIDFGGESPEAAVVANPNYSMRMDGNNVDMEFEMNEQAKNTIAYNIAIQKLNKQLGRIRMAIAGRSA